MAINSNYLTLNKNKKKISLEICEIGCMLWFFKIPLIFIDRLYRLKTEIVCISINFKHRIQNRMQTKNKDISRMFK